MKYWWKTIVRDYLTFTKKDRNGILFLLFLIAMSFLVIPFFKTPNTPVNKDAFLKEIASIKISIDSSKPYRRYTNDDEEDNGVHYQPKNSFSESEKGTLFTFNPNTLDDAGWKRLGIRDKTIATIRKFLDKGFEFRKPDDIKRIYGLKAEQAERLMPFIRIEPKLQTETFVATVKNEVKTEISLPAKSATIIIDINEADTIALKRLKGIGTKLAARIVEYRSKLGGFTTVAQIGETYGLADSTFRNITQQLRCNNPAPVRININSADANQLKAHPYISWNVANAIVRFKEQHGAYKSIDEVMKIEIINDELFTKIAPYLAVQ